jgi:hypothetical protein
MSRFDENIFGRIALHHGFLKKEQLKECLEEGRGASGERDLGQLLLAKGYLNQEQLHLIQSIRRKKARKILRDPKELEKSERSFGQIALRRGWIGVGELEAAILEQDRLRRLNLQFRIGEVLVSLGSLSLEQVLKILAEQKKRILQCPSCDDHYSVSDYRPQEEYRCKKCGDLLTEPLFLDTVAVDGAVESLPAAAAGRRAAQSEDSLEQP